MPFRHREPLLLAGLPVWLLLATSSCTPESGELQDGVDVSEVRAGADTPLAATSALAFADDTPRPAIQRPARRDDTALDKILLETKSLQLGRDPRELTEADLKELLDNYGLVLSKGSERQQAIAANNLSLLH